jgi:hypothetical protein
VTTICADHQTNSDLGTIDFTLMRWMRCLNGPAQKKKHIVVLVFVDSNIIRGLRRQGDR